MPPGHGLRLLFLKRNKRWHFISKVGNQAFWLPKVEIAQNPHVSLAKTVMLYFLGQ